MQQSYFLRVEKMGFLPCGQKTLKTRDFLQIVFCPNPRITHKTPKTTRKNPHEKGGLTPFFKTQLVFENAKGHAGCQGLFRPCWAKY